MLRRSNVVLQYCTSDNKSKSIVSSDTDYWCEQRILG